MFPYSCDALLYHLPIVTAILIALNILAFVAALTGRIPVEEGWLLEYGAGLHPEQWFLSPFMHANSEHLLSNMFFLWAFGLVAEGKLGWWRFLLVYMGIAGGQSAIEQAVMPQLTTEVPFTLGASAAISGLVAMACLWAPLNELSMFVFLLFRLYTFEITIGVFAILFVAMDVLMCMMLGTGAIGSATHLMGAAMGAVVGVALLKTGQVECEDNDLLSVLSGAYGADKRKKREAAEGEARAAERTVHQAIDARRRFDAYLQINQPQQALAVKKRMAAVGQALQLERKDLIKLIAGLHQQKLWKDSAPVMAEFLERFPDDSHSVRLKLAQICLLELDKPGRALELLTDLEKVALPPQHETLRSKIRAVAHRKINEGALEVDDASF